MGTSLKDPNPCMHPSSIHLAGRHLFYDCWVYDLVGFRDLPAGPVVKTSPSKAGGAGSIPGQGVRSHMSLSQKKKKYQNRGWKRDVRTLPFCGPDPSLRKRPCL